MSLIYSGFAYGLPKIDHVFCWQLMFISTVFINIKQPILVLQAKRLKGLMRDPIFAKVAFRLKRQRSGGDGLGQNWKAWNNHEQHGFARIVMGNLAIFWQC